MRTAIIIPGFQHRVVSGRGSRTYQPLLADLRKAGYEPLPITVTWQRHTFDDWLPEVLAQLKGIDASNTLLIGFSYGAMLSMVAATHHAFGRVFLCSLSPYFAEDVPRLKKSWLDMAGHRRISVFETVSFEDVVQNYKARQTTVFAGEVEMERRKAPLLAERGLAAGAQLPNAHFVPVPGAGHDISYPTYAAAIKAEL
jgi:pimeloyl-ACP methyl ester carboxylesterase